jgi:hypothetical protein
MPPRPSLTRADIVQIVNAIVDRLHNLPLGLGGLRRIGTDASSAAPGTLAANDFLVKTASSTLSAERVVTDTATVTWDWGTAGQAKANASTSGLSVLTTKGDLWGFSTVNARIPVGTNGQVLTADSTQALGVKWAAVGGGSGDVVGPASSVVNELMVYADTSGKLAGRATGTGLAKLTSGVLSAVTTWTGAHGHGLAARLVRWLGEPNLRGDRNHGGYCGGGGRLPVYGRADSHGCSGRPTRRHLPQSRRARAAGNVRPHQPDDGRRG